MAIGITRNWVLESLFEIVTPKYVKWTSLEKCNFFLRRKKTYVEIRDNKLYSIFEITGNNKIMQLSHVILEMNNPY